MNRPAARLVRPEQRRDRRHRQRPAGHVHRTDGNTCTIHVRAGSPPTLQTFDCRPFISGNNETCTFNNPAAGDDFVMIRGFAAYSGVTLVGHFP